MTLFKYIVGIFVAAIVVVAVVGMTMVDDQREGCQRATLVWAKQADLYRGSANEKRIDANQTTNPELKRAKSASSKRLEDNYRVQSVVAGGTMTKLPNLDQRTNACNARYPRYLGIFP